MLERIASVFTRRPAATLFVARALLNLLMAYGLNLTIEQFSTTMFFTEAVLGLIGDSTTTPNAKLDPGTVTLAKMGEKP
jgi:hypothetical protein